MDAQCTYILSVVWCPLGLALHNVLFFVIFAYHFIYCVIIDKNIDCILFRVLIEVCFIGDNPNLSNRVKKTFYGN